VGSFVVPDVHYLGCTGIDWPGLEGYLLASGNQDFVETARAAKDQGLSDGEILCSFYAKLCYKSLTLGQNANISRLRDIRDNLRGCFDQGHGSVFEHCQLNFVARNVSRILTHEFCRHRVGTAFSQTSGRYVRGDSLDIVLDPILEPVRERAARLQAVIEQEYRAMVKEMGLDTATDFAWKKKVTSALRRLLPNGQSNEIGFSLNLRSLRHVVQLRTSRHAEWEIRVLFAQVYRLVRAKHPLVFYGAVEEEVDGLPEVSGMRMQPYEPKEG
jgi:thymidylate synthase (FAD)